MAVSGRCSLIRTPGAEVCTDLNSPRTSAGALGLRSHMSMCEEPPLSQMRMVERAWVGAGAALLVCCAASGR